MSAKASACIALVFPFSECLFRPPFLLTLVPWSGLIFDLVLFSTSSVDRIIRFVP